MLQAGIRWSVGVGVCKFEFINYFSTNIIEEIEDDILVVDLLLDGNVWNSLLLHQHLVDDLLWIIKLKLPSQ